MPPASYSYLLYPAPADPAAGPPALLLCLHGAGERGNDLRVVRAHGPPKEVEAGRALPFLIVAPQCPRGVYWEPAGLDALLDEVMAAHPVDRERVCVTGLSMGGYGTWALGARSPHRFAALAPVCGGGDPGTARRLVGLPVWAFHGAQDPVVPLAASEEMVTALRAAGGDVRLTVYPETGHDAWTRTYADPALYVWLAQQRRPAHAPPAARL